MTCAVSCCVCMASIVMTAPARSANAFSSSRTAGISLDFSSTATCPRTVPMPCARAATRCGAFRSLSFAPRTVLPSIAITSRPPARTARVHSHAPRTRSSTSALTRANTRRKVDSSAGPTAAPSASSTSGPASAAHCPIAANDRDPAITAAIPTASSPASGYRRPRLFRGSGTWARRSRRYWLRAAGIGEDGIGGRASLVAGDGERENFHRSARSLPATPRHAGPITCRYDTANHRLITTLRGRLLLANIQLAGGLRHRPAWHRIGQVMPVTGAVLARAATAARRQGQARGFQY